MSPEGLNRMRPPWSAPRYLAGGQGRRKVRKGRAVGSSSFWKLNPAGLALQGIHLFEGTHSAPVRGPRFCLPGLLPTTSPWWLLQPSLHVHPQNIPKSSIKHSWESMGWRRVLGSFQLWLANLLRSFVSLSRKWNRGPLPFPIFQRKKRSFLKVEKEALCKELRAPQGSRWRPCQVLLAAVHYRCSLEICDTCPR